MSFYKKTVILLVCFLTVPLSFAMNKIPKFKFNKVFNKIASKNKSSKDIGKKLSFKKIPKISFATAHFKSMNWKKIAAAGTLAAGYSVWHWNQKIIFTDQEEDCNEFREEKKKKHKATNEINKTVLGDRPPEVQAASNKAFEENKYTGKNQWLYNGTSSGYRLLGLDDDLILKRLVFENQEQNDIYIIDVGCSRGDWGRHAMQVLQSEVCKKSGKWFHIFSITGGQECEETIEQHGNVTLYQFNKFKIENIDEELAKRGFDLNNKVGLVVSRWTLRHLADPFGTLKRIYGLLVPAKGMFMSNGFLFMFNDSVEIQGFPSGNENILAYTNATVLFRANFSGRDAGEFLLVRSDENELEIPLEYTGKIHEVSHRYQCAAKALTLFNKGSVVKNFDWEFIDSPEWDDKRYCIKDDQVCKSLYISLKSQGLFYKSLWQKVLDAN